MPVADRTANPRHQARVRLLAAGIAQRILAIPDGATVLRRAVRVGKVKEQVDRFCQRMCQTVKTTTGHTVIIRDHRESDAWTDADLEAWAAVKAAMETGEPLAGFLFGIGDES